MITRFKWPWVSARRLEALQLENYTLRDALRESNAKVQKYRRLIARLSAGDPETTEAFERASQGTRT